MTEQALLAEALTEERVVVAEAARIDVDAVRLGRRLERLVNTSIGGRRDIRTKAGRKVAKERLVDRLRAAVKRLCAEDILRILWLRARIKRLNEESMAP